MVVRSVAKDGPANSTERVVLTDDDAYEVAKLMARDLLAANEIAKRMYPELYSSGKSADKSRALMRVKHLARRAVRAGLLRVDLPADVRLARALQVADRSLGDVSFYVADDRGCPSSPHRSEHVYREAARLIVTRIDRLLSETSGQVVVGNAGGPTLSHVVEWLPDLISEWPTASSRLCFVSLNAARNADAYHLSANFIAVRMSQVLGGSHIASLRYMSPATEIAYAEALKKIDLVLCGIGTKQGFLSEWLARVHHKKNLPASIVGDACLLPIDKNGVHVPLKPVAVQRSVEDELRPALTYSKLAKLANSDKVVAIAAYPDELSAAASKFAVVRALLLGRLTRSCVLGRSLAQHLLGSFESPSSGS